MTRPIHGACSWTSCVPDLFLGMIMAGISGGILFAGWFNPLPVLLFVIAGIAICHCLCLGHSQLAGMALDPQGSLGKANSGTVAESCA